MNSFGNFVVSVSQVLEFNPATLSGCVDVIVVKQKDGSLKSTPFHARFGKLKVLKCKDKTVKIHINGCDTDLTMKLGNAGEAFFEEDLDNYSLSKMIVEEEVIMIPEIVSSQIETNKVKTEAKETNNALLQKLKLKQTRSNQSTATQTLTSENSDDFLNQQSKLNQKLNSNCSSTNRQRKQAKIIKTLRPSSFNLESLNLNFGANRITYTVESFLQGSQTISGHIYFWPHDANIIVSDVDGTITKTDFFGHVMPMLGKDWSQPGIAPLYTNIEKNGYFLLYLTSRAIGQSQQTKQFLQSIYQDKNVLPQGPLIMSPDGLWSSVKREIVFKRPETFKIAALRDIRNLFPAEHNPFHAGFGNRETDAISYSSVGIPLEKVFIVNPKGDIHHHRSTVAKSYEIINTMLKEIFPGIVKDEKYRLAESLSPSNILHLDDKMTIEEEAAKVAS